MADDNNRDDYIETYFDALLKSYDVLVEAAEKASERGIKLNRQFMAEVTRGQREALEISRKIATDPSNTSQYYGAMLEATTNAQSRALAFTQAAYQEALSASTDARETIEKLVDANRNVAEAASGAARAWAVNNPFTEMFRRGTEAAREAADAASDAAKSNRRK